ncbi:MAG: hypothetical protein U1E82_01190 [Nitrosomonas sp.]|nr:hypothetical protein [Nitrosomonas sp.]
MSKLSILVTWTEARWVKKGDKSVFGYKQLTVLASNGLVMAVLATAVNCHDSELLARLERLPNSLPNTE